MASDVPASTSRETAVDPALIEWMRSTDPALAWQVERELLGAPEATWQATRARVATEGMGARMLALQDADGQWAGGAYFPGDFDWEGPEAAEGAGQPWTATTWTLTTLREWGVDASALEGTAEKLAVNSRWEYEDLPYWGGEVDACINAMTLANGTWLGADVGAIIGWFADHEMSEGGWNCAWVDGSTRASFHSTIASIGGIVDHEGRSGDTSLRVARHRAQEYLLQRRLLYRLTDGEPVGPWIGRFAYPFRWFYSALRALNTLREAALLDGVPPDPRCADAVALVRDARQPDGTWMQERRHPGRVWFEMDVAAGEPSPWLTFHALRVLDWWDRHASTAD